MGKKKVLNEIGNSFLWFVLDELILKPYHIYPILTKIPIYSIIITYTKLHPHIVLLLTIAGILL